MFFLGLLIQKLSRDTGFLPGIAANPFLNLDL
jgi:hypothetical protein